MGLHTAARLLATEAPLGVDWTQPRSFDGPLCAGSAPLAPGDSVALDAPLSVVGRYVLQLAARAGLRPVALLRRPRPHSCATSAAADDDAWEMDAAEARALGAAAVLPVCDDDVGVGVGGGGRRRPLAPPLLLPPGVPRWPSAPPAPPARPPRCSRRCCRPRAGC